MSEPRDELIEGHEYDGIREYDNPLPRWWLILFYGSIAFAVVYVPYYHFGPGMLPHEEYAAEMSAAAAAAPKVAELSQEELEAIAADESKVAAGKTLYQTNCVACHLADGGGLVGPNLTDDYWIHGDGGMAGIVKVVREGVPEKGMIAWKNQLSQSEIHAVSAYVRSLRGTTPAKPKEPQGQKVEATATN